MPDQITEQSIPSPQPPEETSAFDLNSPSHAAAGIPAIISTLRVTSSEMGLVRGMRTLLKVNQPGGVDCPGCAWPEPDQERSHFEFCENGAQHVADEATTKRVTPEFFKQWSVADLSLQSDQWLFAAGGSTHSIVFLPHATHNTQRNLKHK